MTKYQSLINACFKSAYNQQKQGKFKEVDTYVVVDGRQAGPLSSAELRVLVKNGSLTPDTLVWTQGYPDWIQAQFVPHVNKLFLLQEKKKTDNSRQANTNPLLSDIVAAIVQLGYTKQEAQHVAMEITTQKPDISLQDAIKLALKRIKVL